MQSLIAINCKSQDPKKEHAHRAEEERVELADHSWRPELKYKKKENVDK